MKPAALTVATVSAALFSACSSIPSSATQSATSNPNEPGPNLVVLTDSNCRASTDKEVFGRGLGVATLGNTLISGIGGAIFESIGDFVKETAGPDLTLLSAVTNEELYTTHDAEDGSSQVALNPSIRCIHIIRDGFDEGRFEPNTPPELLSTWAQLGLRSEPSAYALLVLDRVSLAGAEFSLRMDEFFVSEFLDTGVNNRLRDFFLIAEFSSPSAAYSFEIEAGKETRIEASSTFASGGIELRGRQKGTFYRSEALKGKTTGWLPFPEYDPEDPFSSSAVNLHLKFLELKRGDPAIEKIGRFLSSDKVKRKVKSQIDEQL